MTLPSAAKMLFLSLTMTVVCIHSSRGADWQDYLSRADSLARAGQFDSSYTLTSKALELTVRTFGGDDTVSARVLYKMAVNLARLGRYREAEDTLRRTVTIDERDLPPGHPHLGGVCNALGLVLKYQGRYQEAIVWYQRSLDIKRRSVESDSPDLANTLCNLGDLYAILNQYSEAEKALTEGIELRTRRNGPDHPSTARAESQLGDLYRQWGRSHQAEPLLVHAVAVLQEAGVAAANDLGLALHNLASLYASLGDYERAIAYYRRALHDWEEAKDTRTRECVLNLALALFGSGDYAAAEPMFHRALNMIESALGPDHAELASALTFTADLYQELGKFSEAESYYLRAREILRKALGEHHPDYALVTNNLAYLYAQTGRPDSARVLLYQALADYSQADERDAMLRADAAESLAEVCRQLRDYRAAESLLVFADSIIVADLSPNYPSRAEYCATLAEVGLESGQFDLVERSTDSAQSIAERTLGTHHPEVARCYEIRASLDRARGTASSALTNSRRAVAIRRDNFLHNAWVLREHDALKYCQRYRQSVFSLLASWHDVATATPLAVEEKAIADAVVNVKGIVTDGMLERRRYLAQESDSAVTHLIAQLRSVSTLLSRQYIGNSPSPGPSPSAPLLDSLALVADSLESAIARQSSSIGQLILRHELSCESLAGLLPSKAVLLEYLKYDYTHAQTQDRDARYLVVAVSASGSVATFDLGPARIIDDLIAHYHSHMLAIASRGGAPSVLDQFDYRPIGRDLYDRLLLPVAEYLKDSMLLLIAPDAALNRVSFAGLVAPDDRYLIEHLTVHYLVGGRDLQHAGTDILQPPSLLLIGGADFQASPADRRTALANLLDTTEIRNPVSEVEPVTRVKPGEAGAVADLPGTRSEVARLEKTWRSLTSAPVRLLQNAAASEDAFKALAAHWAIIHVASHGFFAEGGPPSVGEPDTRDANGSQTGWGMLRSGLLLAGCDSPNHELDGTLLDDGVLTAAEVSTLDLDRVSLVVLSACESGVGEVEQGEGVYGLRRAFLLAGVSSLVIALWPVSDQRTVDLMSEFYKDTGMDLPEILKTGQQSLIETLRLEGLQTHPYSWAGFISLGGWHAYSKK